MTLGSGALKLIIAMKWNGATQLKLPCFVEAGYPKLLLMIIKNLV
jgi:hypothetical protein